jgi:hypothetical protein
VSNLRFRDRSGPRLFLDSRDLIRLLEDAQPLSPSDLARDLNSRRGRIVLVPSNVTELVPYKDGQPLDLDRALDLMRRLEEIPHAFLRSPDLTLTECRAALDAFHGNHSLRSIDPYVDKWWNTMWKIPPNIVRHVLEPFAAEYLDGLSLSEQIRFLLAKPEVIRFKEAHRDKARETMVKDREKFGTKRGTREAFVGALARHVIWGGWPEPQGGIAAFAKYVRRTPEALQGWKTGFAAWEEYRCNLTAIAEVGDLPDFSHVQLLPYVTHATLDRAWQTRCEQAAARLAKIQDPTARFYTRVHANLESILASW